MRGANETSGASSEVNVYELVVAAELRGALQERERIARMLDAHIELAKTAPFSGPSEIEHLRGLVQRIREGHQ